MHRLGIRSWRGIGEAVRWSFTTPAGWWFLVARLGAIAAAVWVVSRHGEMPAIITLVIAIVVAGLIAPPPPDDVRHEREAADSGTGTR